MRFTSFARGHEFCPAEAGLSLGKAALSRALVDTVAQGLDHFLSERLAFGLRARMEQCDAAGQVVEYGPAEAIFNDPQHPYTIGLMNSVPGVGEKRRRLEAIPGVVPSPLDWPTGCRFRDRCTRAEEACAASQPELVEIEPGHWVSCFLVS